MKREIDLGQLGQAMPGLTTAYARALGEAAAVCLEIRHHHPKSAILRASDGTKDERFGLVWEPCSDRQKRCYKDEPRATEWGACGIAIEIAREFTGKVVVETSRKGTGFDYWLGDDDDQFFEGTARLEVSGILRGNDVKIRSRLGKRLAQLEQSDDMGLPGYVAIVDFSAPEARFAEKL